MTEAQRYPTWVRGLPKVDADFPGADGRLITGGAGQAVLWTFEDGGAVPAHWHGPQIGFVIYGCVDLVVDGKPVECGAGQTFFIDDQAIHSATIKPGTLVVEIFAESDRHRAVSDD